MLRELGPASLEWLYYFETEKDRIVVYSSESLKDCMTILEGVNIVIVTDSGNFARFSEEARRTKKLRF